MDNGVHPNWSTAEHFVLGYGSLLSDDSRFRHSDNDQPAVAVSVQGFQRSWITRAFHENQTYVGVTPKTHATLNAHCVPFSLNPKLQQRERDYRFVSVSMSQVTSLTCPNQHLFDVLKRKSVTLWICESLAVYPATRDYPIHLSYIDTCLSGCLAHHDDSTTGVEHARRFIQSTTGWSFIVNDRIAPKYPRSANVSHQHRETIDALLHEFGYSR